MYVHTCKVFYSHPANLYSIKVNNAKAKVLCEIVRSQQLRYQNNINDVALVSLLLVLNRFDTLLVFPLLILNK